MTEFRIELGRTDGYRYVGIQPPLSEEQYTAVTADEDIELELGLWDRSPYSGSGYTEGGFTTELGQGDVHLVKTARKIAEVLRGIDDDDSVLVKENIQQIGHGVHLFGGRDR